MRVQFYWLCHFIAFEMSNNNIMIIEHFHYCAVGQFIKLHLKHIKGNSGSEMSISWLYFKGQIAYQPVSEGQTVSDFDSVPRMTLITGTCLNRKKNGSYISVFLMFLKHPIHLSINTICLTFWSTKQLAYSICNLPRISPNYWFYSLFRILILSEMQRKLACNAPIFLQYCVCHLHYPICLKMGSIFWDNCIMPIHGHCFRILQEKQRRRFVCR